MKKLLMIMMAGLMLFTATSCKKETKAKIVAATVSLALSAPASTALQCVTGMYTNVFLNAKIYELLMKRGNEKQLAAAVTSGAKKGVISKAACVLGVNLLIASGEILKVDDSMLSDDMISDKCTTSHIKEKGTTWLLSKCGI